ncbi:hypothetical protein [Allofrancisella inopinata]|uniref:hypothetical protein n=1 Tax=Allofrancisella inopinata TaxID=1085647 RepID=UPI001FB66C54|nr:hypothetical protein [Allofrancisella inopinata]
MKKHLIILSTIFLASCASQPVVKPIGKGIVKYEKETMSKAKINAQASKDGAEDGAIGGAGVGAVGGAGVGAIAGGLTGGALGVVCSVATLGIGTVPCMAAGVGGGAAIGAGFGAVTGAGVGAVGGAIVGGGGSYIYVANKDDIIGKYEYEVAPENGSESIIFEEFPDKNYPKDTKVVIYESDYKGAKNYFIKSLYELENSSGNE